MDSRVERLKKAIVDSQASYRELSEQTGISKSALQRYASGVIEKIPIDVVEKIAKATGVSPEYIMGWDETVNKVIGYPYKPTQRIPVLGCISAGLPLYAEQHIEGYMYTDLNHGGEYFGLRVKGDSMNAARIQEGDVVVVRRQPVVENGEIAIVLVDGENATVKKFYQNGHIVTLVPQSTNQEHQAQMHDTRKIDIKILGKVVRNEINF